MPVTSSNSTTFYPIDSDPGYEWDCHPRPRAQWVLHKHAFILQEHEAYRGGVKILCGFFVGQPFACLLGVRVTPFKPDFIGKYKNDPDPRLQRQGGCSRISRNVSKCRDRLLRISNQIWKNRPSNYCLLWGRVHTFARSAQSQYVPSSLKLIIAPYKWKTHQLLLLNYQLLNHK